MGKYRHKVTGKVREYEDSYARAIRALEPVSDDTEESSQDCGPCGAGASVVPAGVVDDEAVSVDGEPSSYLDYLEPAPEHRGE